MRRKKSAAADVPRPVFVVHSCMAHHLERKPFTQPPPNNFSNLPTTMLQPRLNHPSCRIQERFRLNHPPFVILQLRLNYAQKDSFGGGRKLLLMEPRRIRRIHSLGLSLHRLTAAASTTRCRRYKTLSAFIPTTTTLCKRSGDGGGEGRALRGRMRPRDWRRGNGSHAGRQTGCRLPVNARNLSRKIRTEMSSRPSFKMQHPPLRPHHKGLPPTIMLSYLFAAEK